MVYRRTRRTRKRTAPRRKFSRPTKRSFRKRFRSRIPKPLNGFPDSIMSRHRSVTILNSDPASSGKLVWVFSANGMFVRQPMGFDEMMARYNHFTVVGSKITVKAFPFVVGNVDPGMIIITTSANEETDTTYASLEHLLEQRLSTGKKMVGSQGVTTAGGGTVICSARFSAKKFFGTKFIVGGSQYRGSSTANPTEGAFFNVHHHSIAANNPGALSLVVQIDYIAVFSEPKHMARS